MTNARPSLTRRLPLLLAVLLAATALAPLGALATVNAPGLLAVSPAEATWVEDRDLAFAVDTAVYSVTDVLVNDVKISASHYFAISDLSDMNPILPRAYRALTRENSYVVLRKSYLATLAAGTYDLTFKVGAHRIGTAQFTIAAKTGKSTLPAQMKGVFAHAEGETAVKAKLLDSGSKTLATLDAGEKITVTLVSGSYAAVRYGQQRGYIALKKLNVTFRTLPTVTTTLAKAGLYAKRDDDKPSLRASREGYTFEATAVLGEWTEVLYKDKAYYMKTGELTFSYAGK